MPNYSQPDFRNPVLDPRVSVQVENVGNPLLITAAVAKYAQPGTSAPAAPAPGQLGDAMGRSKLVRADGVQIG